MKNKLKKHTRTKYSSHIIRSDVGVITRGEWYLSEAEKLVIKYIESYSVKPNIRAEVVVSTSSIGHSPNLPLRGLGTTWGCSRSPLICTPIPLRDLYTREPRRVLSHR